MIYEYRTDWLSAVERRRLKVSCVLFGILGSFSLLSVVGVACFLATFDEISELVFLIALLLVCLGGSYMFTHGFIGSLKDYRQQRKRVVVGTISRIDREVISHGLMVRIWVDEIPFSDPLFPPEGGMICFYVGQRVEVSWLINSLRALSIRSCVGSF